MKPVEEREGQNEESKDPLIILGAKDYPKDLFTAEELERFKKAQNKHGTFKWDLEFEKTLPEREFGQIEFREDGKKYWGEYEKGTKVRTGRIV